MKMWIWFLASLSGLGSGIVVSYGVGRRHDLDPALLWMWRRPADTAPIWLLAWKLHVLQVWPWKEKKKKKKHKLLCSGPLNIVCLFNGLFASKLPRWFCSTTSIESSWRGQFRLFVYFGCAYSVQKFLGQELNLHHSSNQNHSSDKCVSSLTHWTNRELPELLLDLTLGINLFPKPPI